MYITDSMIVTCGILINVTSALLMKGEASVITKEEAYDNSIVEKPIKIRISLAVWFDIKI